MPSSSTTREALYRLALAGEESARLATRDQFAYRSLLDEIFFHSDLRYADYLPFRSEGEFPARLARWLENVSSAHEKQLLLRMLRWLIFLDRRQTIALSRDIYRRIIQSRTCGAT